MREPQVGYTQRAEIGAGTLEHAGDALNGKHILAHLRQHRRLIAAPGAHFKHASEIAAVLQRLDHARHDVRLGDRLLKADGQRRILIRPCRKGLVDKQVPGDKTHCRQHALIADALLAQPLDHAVARTLRGHADAAYFDRHAATQAQMSAICCVWVRSTCSGVIDTLSAATA